ncbi:MAG: ParB/RepB/Spo0J family partition protein, partial [Candidatus Contendobacter sp.]|nr:ParB/RepB/Spo0J family partition protein [Candidatus Contendobacter sp.]
MTGNSVAEIAVSNIQPSPFQHRRMFDDGALRELAKSIQQDGLIQPITVRPVNAHFELIAGERRWRAFQLAGLADIPARILEVDDLQARRLCATENLQRADLTPLEEVMALTELVDASLLEFSAEYAPLSAIQEPKWRVKALLGKLESDRANKTDYFITKFSDKVDEIFSGLPKPKEYGPFTRNDL